MPAGHPGARLLYATRLEGPDGRHTTLRLAAAVAPPGRLRLEALGPAGGTRLVLATDGAKAVALAVPERRFDVADATPQTLARWTGLPLGPAALVALLTGQPPCPAAAAGDAVAADADPCPGLLFRPLDPAPGDGAACSGTLHTAPQGALVATIECAGGEAGGWADRIRVELPRSGRIIELRRTDGPVAARLAEALFAPVIPDGFRRADLLGTAGTGSLLEDDGGSTP